VCYDPKVALFVMQYMCCETMMFILLPSTASGHDVAFISERFHARV